MLGRSHPLLRRVRELRRDAALRRRAGLVLVEGRHLAGEALSSGATIEVAVISAALGADEAGRRLVASLTAAGVPCHETSDDRLAALQDARSPQPIVCLVRHAIPDAGEAVRRLARSTLVVVAHGIQDPGNLGALLRTAEAAGADCLVCTGAGVDLTHPRVVRASQGSFFRLPAWAARLDALATELRAEGFRVAAADPRAGTDFREADLRGKLAVMLGAEGPGLGPSERAVSDLRLRIPMRGRVESLSVGVAAGLLLFEAARQRGRPR